MLSGDGSISFERLSLRGGDEYGRQRLLWSASRLERWSSQRFAVWTGDLGFVKVGACVGLCISVAVWAAWRLVLVFTLAEEDVVSFGGR